MPHLSKTVVHEIIDIANFPRIEDSKRIDERGVEHYTVPEGIYVPSYSNGCSELKKVTEFTIHPNCKEHVIDTHLGRSIVCSEHHSLATLNWDTLIVDKTDAIDAMNKLAPVLRGYSTSTLSTLPGYTLFNTNGNATAMLDFVDMSYDAGWFIGATIGDGWVNDLSKYSHWTGARKKSSTAEGAALSLAYGKEDSSIAKKWRKIARHLSNKTDAKITKVRSDHEFEGHVCTSHKSTISSTALARFMEPLIGHLAEGKHLPPNFMNMPLEFRQGLLTGLLDTDGTMCWTHDKGLTRKKPQFACSYTTISGRLASEIKLLAMSLGLMATITISQRNENPVYLLSFSIGPIRDASWLKPVSESRMKALSRLRENTESIRGRTDIVPLPPKIKEEAKLHLRNTGAIKKINKDKAAYSAYIDICSRDFSISRSTCMTLLKVLESQKTNFSDYFKQWIGIVNNQNIGWDQITDVKCTGELKTMYDITVPDSWTFCTDDGLYIWDSMNFHVPISDLAVKQAKEKMLPSRNLFSLTDLKSVRHSPSMEMTFGLYKLTEPATKKLPVRFASISDAKKAYREGKIGLNDPIII